MAVLSSPSQGSSSKSKPKELMPTSLLVASTLAILWGGIQLLSFAALSISIMKQHNPRAVIFLSSLFALPGILLILGGVGVRRGSAIGIILTGVVAAVMAVITLPQLTHGIPLGWLGTAIYISIVVPLTIHVIKKVTKGQEDG